MDVLLSKRPDAIRPKEGTSPFSDKEQLILNMGAGGSMQLERRSQKRPLRGPAVGGDFSKARRKGKRTVARLNDFRSRACMYRAIWQGRFKKTVRGLTKDDLRVNWLGRIVAKRKSAHCKKLAQDNGWANKWRNWIIATRTARHVLSVKGFMKVKPAGTEEEQTLYNEVRRRWSQAMEAGA